MKMIGIRTLACAASLAAVVGAGARAQENKPAAVSEQDLQSKMSYCKTCHGVTAQGFRGSAPMPRLAGQQPGYIETQLKAFIEHRRLNPIMNNVAHVLTPEMVAALGAQFEKLNPGPLGGAPKDHLDEGKKIFEEGLPSAEVPPCASCHGADGHGGGEIPRLAGQLDDYIVKKLSNWDKERGQDKANPDNSQMMTAITHKLTAAQLAAVAAYVSYLK